MSEHQRATHPRAGGASIRSGGWSLLFAALLLTACPVDDRLLTAEQSGAGRPGNESGANAGAGTGAGGDAAMNGGSSDAGALGVASDSEGGSLGYADGCADLDRDDVSDCTETLLKNPGFTSDTMNWTAETDASISWDARDLLESRDSGSAVITSSVAVTAPGDSLVAARQCISVRAGTILGVFANARIDAGQTTGRAAVSLWFYAGDDCPGETFSEAYETLEQFEPGQVLTLQGSKTVPSGMRSAQVRLGVIKPNAAARFAVHFDNILVREE